MVAGREFGFSAAEDPQHVNLSRLKCNSVDMVWKLGEDVPAQVSSSSLDRGSKLRGSSPVAFVLCNKESLTPGIQH
ncbi:hypothetical protein TNCV_2244591 [Trichonephila clavipes]|nr:hypothetical protein TNCV_2244591 [Trichonephila clavipes]